MKKDTFKYQLLITGFSIVTIGVLIHATDVYADPTSLPPVGPVDVLLNESSDPQTKTGPLTINGNLHANLVTAGQVNAGSLCLSGDCRGSWPGADGSTQSFGTVMNNGNTLSSNAITAVNSWLIVNGQWRNTWPRPSWTGMSAGATFYRPGWCPGAGHNCGSSIHQPNGGFYWFNTDWWGNISSTGTYNIMIGTQ